MFYFLLAETNLIEKGQVSDKTNFKLRFKLFFEMSDFAA